MSNAQHNQFKVENLAVFRAEIPLFDEVSFSLNSGESIQISGANGSGKTSLLRCLCGTSSRHQGDISWNGEAITGTSSTFYSQLLYLGHSLGLKPKLTVLQNLNFFQRLRFNKNDQIIHETLNQLNIEGYHDELVANLSAGQKRRVSLCRLFSEPVKLWVLDEPMVALDAQGQKWLEDSCNAHLDSGGMIILTSHQKLKGINGLQQLSLVKPDFSALIASQDAAQ